MFNILCDSRNYIKCTSFDWYKTNISLNPVPYTNTEGLLDDQPTENESNHVELKWLAFLGICILVHIASIKCINARRTQRTFVFVLYVLEAYAFLGRDEVHRFHIIFFLFIEFSKRILEQPLPRTAYARICEKWSGICMYMCVCMDDALDRQTRHLKNMIPLYTARSIAAWFVYLLFNNPEERRSNKQIKQRRRRTRRGLYICWNHIALALGMFEIIKHTINCIDFQLNVELY